jgi:hypothetical protein
MYTYIHVLYMQGPGTQIRKGRKINIYTSLGSLDPVPLNQLLTAAGVAWLSFPSDVIKVFATDDMSGIAVITQPSDSPAPFLHTFALRPKAYAEGTENALWKEIVAIYPSLVWVGQSLPGMGESVTALKKTGNVPATFPVLSSRRSVLYASGGISLEGPSPGVSGASGVTGGKSLLWRGLNDSQVATAISYFRQAQAQPAASTTPTTPRPVATPATGSGSRSIKVGLLGARGYVGRELVRLVAGHPHMQVTCASSRALVGQDVLTALGVPDAAAGVLPGLTMSDISPEQLK